MISLFKKGRWYHDFTRGVAFFQIRITALPRQAAFEAERIHLTYRLQKIDKKLFNTYRMLGQQAVDCITGRAPLVLEEELQRLYQQIRQILNDRKKAELELAELTLIGASKEEGYGPFRSH
jgi:hypothetical protein